MINKNIKTLNAFSLTEVLVTMFIIMLLIIASAPMITKKNTKNKAPHGSWECFLDENGKHVSQISVDGQAKKPGRTDPAGDYCIFEPQQNAQNYTIVTIGGGGGGAAGTAFSMDAASYSSPTSYTAPANGSYLLLIVGGGGGGSAYQGKNGAKGGGAGGITRTSVTLKKNDYVVLEAGVGGQRGGATVDENAEANNCTGDASVGWHDDCKGGDGNPSKFYIYSTNQTIEVEGGKGGGTSPGNNGSDGNVQAYIAANGEDGVKIDYNSSNLKDFINSEDKSAVSFGFGGKGYRNKLGGQGLPGVVMIVSNSHHAGGGGKRGTSAYTSLNKITDEVKVYVGKGGEGAVTEDTNGKQGENSSFGYYITAKGGEGGIARYKSTSGTETLIGEKGGQSPYGGTVVLAGSTPGNLNGQNNMDENDGIVKATETEYGAGGSGGSSLARSGTSGSSKDRWGKGGRGMPGYVRVEWN